MSFSLKNLVIAGALLASSAPSYAAYVRVAVPVPKAQVTTALPAYMYFYVDTRFSTTERARLNVVMLALLNQWQVHYAQRATSGRSVYQTCVNNYATRNLRPSWASANPANGAASAALAMDGFTRQIVANGFSRTQGFAFVNYEVPRSSSSYFTMKAANASNPDTNAMTITVNPQALSRTDLSILTLAGSLHHAWLHREGFSHPNRSYTTYTAGEAPMCIMRNNTNKIPGQNDSVYTRFLD